MKEQCLRFPLKLHVLRGSWEGDYVADVLHAGGELDGALEAQAEAGVGDGAVAAQVQVPPVVFRVSPADISSAKARQLLVGTLTPFCALLHLRQVHPEGWSRLR